MSEEKTRGANRSVVVRHEQKTQTSYFAGLWLPVPLRVRAAAFLRFVFGCLLVQAMSTPTVTAGPGPITIEPDTGVAGQFGTWVVTYEVGSDGLSNGGGIRVQLPDSWHSGPRNSAKRVQATQPGEDHYVSARTSRSGVHLETRVESESKDLLVKSARRGLDGRSERYVFVVRVSVLTGHLTEGDTISVVYGDRSRGSRGMQASMVTTAAEPVLVAVDSDGSGKFRLQADLPTIRTRSGPATELLVTSSSFLQVGQPASVHVAVVDANSNPVSSYDDEFQVHVLTGQADVESSIRLRLDQGFADIPLTPTATGILRLLVSTRQGLLQARCNPIEVSLGLPERKLYWGDLHSHTRFSWDAVGSNSFQYAREVAGLDFYAMTDHSSASADDGYSHGLGPHNWEEYTSLTEKYDDPGEFVTLHAYEASFGSPFGHHNVYFRDVPGPLVAPGRVSLPDLWELLEAGQALTIPHHTGKFPVPILWEPHDSDFRRNIEIYSAHGSSEEYSPEDPLAFEQSDFTAPSVSTRLPQFVQDAWVHGLVLSTIAASDDHRSQPGHPHWGLAAVRATGLTRGEIFDALYERRTYGTTGARILLDFSIDGIGMGQQMASAGGPEIQIEAHGTDDIETVEVLRYGRTDGHFKVLYRIQPDAPDFSWRRVDRSFREDSIYYVRLRQKGLVRNRIVMAWSSPIWVRLEP